MFWAVSAGPLGTAVVQVLGAELTAGSWADLRGDVHHIIHRGLAADKKLGAP